MSHGEFSVYLLIKKKNDIDKIVAAILIPRMNFIVSKIAKTNEQITSSDNLQP